MKRKVKVIEKHEEDVEFEYKPSQFSDDDIQRCGVFLKQNGEWGVRFDYCDEPYNLQHFIHKDGAIEGLIVNLLEKNYRLAREVAKFRKVKELLK